MLFNSLQYLAFLAVTVSLYWAVPAGVWRRRLLLVASIGFYASFDLRLPLLLLVISITSWLVARTLPGLQGTQRKVTAGLGIGASVLAVFGLRAYGWLTHGTAVAAAPTAFGGSVQKAIVPVGLAFVTFHSISYIVDVYRKQMEPNPSFADHVLYICFFPHLLAGPVMRARRLVPAFHSVPKRPNPVLLSEGAELLVVGMFKKVVLADPAIGLVTRPSPSIPASRPAARCGCCGCSASPAPTSTSPATSTWPGARPSSSASSCSRTACSPSCDRRTSPSSGGGGRSP